MGHLHLGHLPRTVRWKRVVELLDEGSAIPELAKASLFAAQTGLKRIPNDSGFLTTLNSIIELTSAARDKDISSALYKAGIGDSDQTSSFAFLSAITNRLSENLSKIFPRSDVGKIAQDSFISSLSRQLRGQTGSLFGDMSDDVRSLTNPFRGKQFKLLMHEFYSDFTGRYLSYHLSREFPNHVGISKQFASLDQMSEFSRDFNQYCRESVRIADEFTPGWLGRAIYEKDYGPDAVKKYAHVAFKKITSEFLKGGD